MSEWREEGIGKRRNLVDPNVIFETEIVEIILRSILREVSTERNLLKYRLSGQIKNNKIVIGIKF